MRRAGLFLAVFAVTLGAVGADAQRRYIDGVFVQSPSGPIELIAYAEAVATGRLRLANGSMDDVPTWGRGCRVLVSLPAWRAGGAIIATEAIFDDPLAERRDVRWFVRPLNIYTDEMEFKELARTDFITRMLKNVKASDTMPAYVFIIVSDNVTRVRSNVGLRRFYPVRVDATATSSACKP